MHPGQSLAERREALKAAEINQQLPRIASMLHMLAAGEAGRLRLFTKTDHGNAQRGIVLHGQRKVAQWLREKPVLMLNATARIEDVRRFFPDAVMADLPQAHLPHQRVHQILGSFGKFAMSEKKLADLEADARAHVAAGKSLLVICYERDEARFRKITDRVLHHGNYAGDDDHGDVDVIMHIGGPFARSREIAEMATARYGEPVPIAQPVRKPCVALMEDGSGVAFERMAYEDPLAQRVHEGIYDQAFVQGGLGRGRGINRSADTSLTIYVYGNVPLPVPLATLRRWEPVRERHLLTDGGTHSNAADLHRFTSEFPSLEAAMKWRQRNPYDEARLRALLADDPRAFDKITWQPAGQGHKPRCSIIPATEVRAFRQKVERHFGRLPVWVVERFTAGCLREEMDIGSKDSFEPMSDSSPTIRPIEGGAAGGRGHRVEHPPDG
jgi:putative DNA primase/helicase